MQKTREQDFRKGVYAMLRTPMQSRRPRSGVARARLHLLCIAMVRGCCCPPRPARVLAPRHFIRIGACSAGVYIHYTSTSVTEIRLPVDGRYLILCRGSMGVGRDQVRVLHGSLPVGFLACCGADVSCACDLCVCSLPLTCPVRHRSGTAIPGGAGHAWRQTSTSRKTTCFVSWLVRLEDIRAAVAGGRLWRIAKLKHLGGMPGCRDHEPAR